MYMMTPSEVRLPTVNNGYRIVPLRDGKIPALQRWPDLVADSALAGGWAHTLPRANNTGVITGHANGPDVDILQQEAADALDTEIRRLYPGVNFCVRYGMAPKRLFMFRSAEPFATFRKLLLAPEGSGLKVRDG